VLEELRKELDELKGVRMEDLTGVSREWLYGQDDDKDMDMDGMQQPLPALEDEDTAGSDLEDSVAVTEAENEVEEPAEMTLPIRSLSEVPAADTTTANDPTTNTAFDTS
jgi:hypothetical protein